MRLRDHLARACSQAILSPSPDDSSTSAARRHTAQSLDDRAATPRSPRRSAPTRQGILATAASPPSARVVDAKRIALLHTSIRGGPLLLQPERRHHRSTSRPARRDRVRHVAHVEDQVRRQPSSRVARRLRSVRSAGRRRTHRVGTGSPCPSPAISLHASSGERRRTKVLGHHRALVMRFEQGRLPALV